MGWAGGQDGSGFSCVSLAYGTAVGLLPWEELGKGPGAPPEDCYTAKKKIPFSRSPAGPWDHKRRKKGSAGGEGGK